MSSQKHPALENHDVGKWKGKDFANGSNADFSPIMNFFQNYFAS